MSLRQRILAYVSAARSSPVMASDPGELRALERDALSTLDAGFATLAAPIAPFTWEVRTLLTNITNNTNRVKFAFPWRVNVVGMQATLSIVLPRVGAPLPDPTLNDIDCMVDINNSAFLTGNDGLTTPIGQGGNNFVTLATLSIQTPRLLGLALEGESKPELGFTFRWKQPPPVAGPLYQSCIISVALFCYPQGILGPGQQTSFGLVGT